MLRAMLLVVGGFVIGVVAGFLLWKDGGAASRDNGVICLRTDANEGQGSPPSDGRTLSPSQLSDKQVEAICRSHIQPLEAQLAAAEAAVEKLEADTEKLAKSLGYAAEEERAATGDPIPFPADIDAKYRQEAMVRAFTDALKERGVAGAVADVDCSEFPCILSGTLEGDYEPPVFRDLLNTTAMSAYGDASASSSSGVQDILDEHGRSRKVFHFAVGYLPSPNEDGPFKNPDSRQKLGKRSAHRVRSLFDAAHGQ